MNARDVITVAAAIATVVNGVAVAVGIPFLIMQGQAASKNLEQAARGLRQTAVFSLRTHLTDINQILIADERLRQKFNLEAHEVLAYMILNDFETLWTYHEEGLLPEAFWNSKVNLIRHTLRYEWIKALWQRDAQRTPGRAYQHEFVNFIDGLLAEEKPRSSFATSSHN